MGFAVLKFKGRFMQKYRSGHNGADSKSVWGFSPRGFESHLLRQQKILAVTRLQGFLHISKPNLIYYKKKDIHILCIYVHS